MSSAGGAGSPIRQMLLGTEGGLRPTRHPQKCEGVFLFGHAPGGSRKRYQKKIVSKKERDKISRDKDAVSREKKGISKTGFCVARLVRIPIFFG